MNRKILFLCHRLPYPPNKGDKIRSYALLRHLATRGKVSVGCFIDEQEDLQYADTVRGLAGGECYFEHLRPTVKLWRSACALLTGKAITVGSFGSIELRTWIKRMLRDVAFDDVVIFGSAMAPYMLDADFPPNRVMFDMVDIDSDKWNQYARVAHAPLTWIYRREARTLERLERKAAKAFGQTLLVSPFEAEAFRCIAPESAAKIKSLTNGVDLETYSPGNCESPFPVNEIAIVMTGRMDYRPNYEGAIWFATEIMPRIVKLLPQARVYFVGANPPGALLGTAGDNVIVTGSVTDIRPYLQFAQAVIAPLKITRGVQNKVLEAMAMEKPVVATREAARSLAVETGNQLWIENDPERFAAAVLAALHSPERDRIARNGRRYIENHHNWARLMAEFDLALGGMQNLEAHSAEARACLDRLDNMRAPARFGAGE